MVSVRQKDRRRLALVIVVAGAALIPAVVQADLLTTTPGDTVVLGSGDTLTDSAVLTGSGVPTGNITFFLFSPGVTPNGSDSNNVYSDTVTVTGNGSYDTALGTNPGGYFPTVAGTYEWLANYSGDGGSNAPIHGTVSEPEVVTSSAPAVPEPSSVFLLCTVVAAVGFRVRSRETKVSRRAPDFH